MEMKYKTLKELKEALEKGKIQPDSVPKKLTVTQDVRSTTLAPDGYLKL